MSIKNFADKFGITFMVAGFLTMAIGGVVGIINPLNAKVAQVSIVVGIILYAIGRIPILIAKSKR